MYLVKTPAILKPLAKDFVWKIDTSKKIIYLTFDDGPTPEVTEKVLSILKEYNAKATFFCLGKNVEQHPELYLEVLNARHTTGSHSYSHKDGWKTNNYSYIKDALRGNQKINSTLFRPPYGHITLSQTSSLKKRFKLIMWDVISGDFDKTISAEKCLQNVINNTEAGSIVVFHDSVKAAEKMLQVLPQVLKHYGDLGFKFEALSIV